MYSQNVAGGRFRKPEPNIFSGIRLIFQLFCLLAIADIAYATSSLNVPSTVYVAGTGILRVDGYCDADECDIKEKTASGWVVRRTVDRGSFYYSDTRSPKAYTFQLSRCTVTTMYNQTYRSWCSGGDYTQTAQVKSISAPTLTVSTEKSSNGKYQVTIRSTGATSFKLTKNSGDEKVYSGNGSVSINYNDSNGTYTYKNIKACVGSGWSESCLTSSSQKTVRVAITPSSVSSITVPGLTDGKFQVTWGAASGANHYQLHQETDGDGSWDQIYEGSLTAEQLQALDEGTYRYRVKSCRKTGSYLNCGTAWKYSSYVSVKPPVTPVLEPITDSDTGQYVVSWSSVTNRDSYELQEQKGSDTGWVFVPDLEGASKRYSKTDSATYRYRVRACNDVGCSSWSPIESVDVAHPPAQPEWIRVPSTLTDGHYTVSWSPSNGAISYRLIRKAEAADAEPEVASDDVSTTFSEAIGVAGTYTYSVAACLTIGDFISCSDERVSEPVQVQAPDQAPVLSLPTSSDSGTYTLSWSEIGNTNRYELEESVNPGFWSPVGRSDHAEAFEKILGNSSNTYSYRVKACNAIGCSAFSDVATIDVARDVGVPVLTVPEGNTDGFHSVRWTAVDGATHYKLKRVTGSDSTLVYSGAGTEAGEEGLALGSHDYQVRACRTVGDHTNCSDWGQPRQVTVAVPDAISDTALQAPAENSSGDYTVSWSKNGNTNTYRLEELTEAGDWVTLQDTSSRLKQFTAKGNGTYRYRVTARNAAGDADPSPVKTIYVAIAPGLPTSITTPSNATDGVFDVTWGEATAGSVTAYELQRRAVSGTWTSVPMEGTSFSESSLSEGLYQYRVRACRTTGSLTSCSNWVASSEVSVAPPAEIPVLDAPEESGTGVYNVSWRPVPNARRYTLQEYVDGSWVTLQDQDSTALGVDGKGNGSNAYRVRACNKVGCTDYSAPATTDVALQPGIADPLTADPNGRGGVLLTWGTPVGDRVTSYEVEFQINGGAWIQHYSGLAQEAELTPLGPGEYTFQVKACNSVGNYTNCSDWVQLPEPIHKPTGVITVTAPDNSNTGAYDVSWTGLNDTYHYTVQEAIASGDWYDEVTNTSFTEHAFTAKPNNRYNYRVKACNDFGCSPYSSGKGVEVALTPGVPASITVPELTDGSYEVAWGSGSGEISAYELEQRAGDAPWAPVYAGLERQYAVSDLGEDTYLYRVRACQTTGSYTSCSDWRKADAAVAVAAPAAAPSGFTVPEMDEDGTYTLNWADVDNATAYQLQERVGDGEWTSLPETTALRHTFTDKAENRYSYRVSACNAVGCSASSEASAVQVLLPPGTPGRIVLPATSDGNFDIVWGAANGSPTRYELQERQGAGAWAAVYDGPSTSTSRSGLAGGTYAYQVRACRDVGGFSSCSDWRFSDAIVSAEKPEAEPAQLSAPALDEDGNYTISWASVANASYYLVEEQERSGNWAVVAQASAIGVDLADKPEGLYTYRVAACNAIGCSGYALSGETRVMYKPQAPENVLARADASTLKTKIEWEATFANPSAYELRQRIGNGSWGGLHTVSVTNAEWPTPVDASGVYQYQVRSCRQEADHTLCSDWAPSNTVTYAPPGSPVMHKPPVNADGSYTLSWSDVAYSDHYRLNEDGALETLDGTSKDYSGKANGRYTYRVQACNALGCGTASDPVTITVRIADPNEGGVLPEDVVASLPPDAPDSTDPVGAITGEFRVNEAGAATYSIPLSLPKGTAGVTPQLSLEYSSQNGNGLIGQGWTLGGVSTITRCRQTLSQDGQARAITWSHEDRFCLDGQRLMLVDGSRYGAVGANYKTEIDSFVLVKSHMGTDGHPAYFSVKAKDGSISFYGGSPDGTNSNAHQKAGDHTLTWAVSRFEDSVGNRIEFSYYNNAGEGLAVKRISYAYPQPGSNTSAGAVANFVYDEIRPDVARSYVAGHEVRQSRRLTVINVQNRVHSTLSEYRRYEFTYQHQDVVPTDSLSRLVSLEECVGDVCLRPTKFDWPDVKEVTIEPGVQIPDDSHDYSPPVYESPYDAKQFFANIDAGEISVGTDYRVAVYTHIDINGDGKLDLAWVQYKPADPDKQFAFYALADANGNYDSKVRLAEYETDLTIPAGMTRPEGGVEFYAVDYNLDGRQDLITRQRDAASGAWKLHLAAATTSGWQMGANPTRTLPFENTDLQFGDIDSDGTTDAFYMKDEKLRVHFLKPVSNPTRPNRGYAFDSTATSYTIPQFPALGEDEQFGKIKLATANGGDFNGDGRIDVIVEFPIDEYQERTEYRNGEPYTYPGLAGRRNEFHAYTATDDGLTSVGKIPTDTAPIVADLNADGLSDIVFKAAGKWNFALSQGNGWGTPQRLINIPDIDKRHVLIVDVNRDGYPDLLWGKGAQGMLLHPWHPAENRFATESVQFTSAWNFSEADQQMVVDVNGDGWMDFLSFRPQSGRWSIKLANHTGDTSPNLMTGIEDGLGVRTAIDYELLTHTNRYSHSDVGESAVTLEDVCVQHPANGASVCYAPQWAPTAYEDFYRALLDPASTVPAGNDQASSGTGDTPVIQPYAPIPIVTEVRTELKSATGDSDPEVIETNSYFYDELRVQAAGRGSLGFRKLTTIHHEAGRVTETRYRQDWPFLVSPLETVVKTIDGNVLSRATNIWGLKEFSNSGTKRYQPFLKQTVEKSYELAANGTSQGSLLKEVRVTNEYDNYGNPTSIETITEGGNERITQHVENTYGTDTEAKRLGRLSQTTVVTSDGSASKMRTSSFTYYSGSDHRAGLLKTETVDTYGQALTTTYDYDDWGNKASAVQTASDGTSRHSETTTYTAGRYADTVENALGHKKREVTARNAFGEPTRITQDGRMQVTIEYDDLGREYLRKDSTGAWSWTSSRYCGGSVSCPAKAKYRIEQRLAGGGRSYTYHDALGRTVREMAIGFDGSAVKTDTRYDKRGRIAAVSTPYTGTSPEAWTSTTYDLLGRPLTITQPDGEAQSTIVYDGFVTTTTNALLQTKHETHNLQGELIEVTDNLQGTVRYQYDLNGNLLSATTDAPDADPVTVRMCYDALGRKMAMHDPDKGGFAGNADASCENVQEQEGLTGWWYYRYNGIGDLTSQTDPKGQTRTMTYDALGRMISRTDWRSGSSVESYTRWYYDGDDTGSGQPGDQGNLTLVVHSQNGISNDCGPNSHCTMHLYDDLGRGTDTLTLHPGAGDLYQSGVRYDSIGRIAREYDVLQELTGQASGVLHRYNDYGYKSEIVDLRTATSLYRVNAMDARGNVTSETRGAFTTRYYYDRYFGRLEEQITDVDDEAGIVGLQNITYTWDGVGNLMSRHNQSAVEGNTGHNDLRESFCYDGLNRLIKSHKDTLHGSCSLSSSDQDVEYDGLGNITRKAGVGRYEYGTHAGPHAVTSAGGVTYTYDGNGNMVSGDGRTLKYNAHDKPIEIGRDGHKTEFRYGPDRSRYLRVDSNNGVRTTTRYLGSVERIYTEGDSTITWRRTVAGAVQTVTTDLANQVQARDFVYLLKDHLGSTDIIVDKDANVVQSQSFDAWGQRRNAVNWDAFSALELLQFKPEKTKRGYTGHEHLDELGLIHMNGRVYDPKLARFLQADPFIQAASNTQSYNRYSYLLNNPLNATDPSGFFLKKLWDEVRPYVGVIIAVVATYICAGTCAPAAYAWIGLGAGAAGAAANGANLGGIILGAVTGAAAANPYAGMIAAGAASYMTGGSFGRGFAAAGIGSGMSYGASLTGGGATTFIAATVAGGVSSKITGGKFKNGAATAAFMWALRAGASKLSASDVEEVGGGSQAKQGNLVNKSLSDNIRRDEDGNLVLDFTVGAEAGQEAQRDLLVEKVSGKWEGKGGCNVFGFGCDSSQSEHLIVNATAVDGVGDITVYSRDTMSVLVPDPRWAKSSFCEWACAAKGSNYMHIDSMSMSGGKYLHEVFHNYGLTHSRGLMHKNGGTLTAKNINSLGALHGY